MVISVETRAEKGRSLPTGNQAITTRSDPGDGQCFASPVGAVLASGESCIRYCVLRKRRVLVEVEGRGKSARPAPGFVSGFLHASNMTRSFLSMGGRGGWPGGPRRPRLTFCGTFGSKVTKLGKTMAHLDKRVAHTLLALGLFAAAAPAAGHARHAIKPAPRVTVSAMGKVLRGDPRAFTGIATLDRKRVFEAIPAYQQLREERLHRTDPRYHFLLAEANKVFNRTLDRACKHYQVDLIVEDGHVSASGLRVYELTAAMERAVAARRGGTNKR